MSRAILILGGGLMQLPAISAARAHGLDVHVTDGNPDCVGRGEADIFHHVDLRDIDGLVSLARGIGNLAAVFTAGTDFSASVAQVAAACGLPGVAPEAAQRATDKGIMRRCLAAAGVPVPAFQVIGERDALPDEVELPCVVKPADSMGARAVRLVSSREELATAVDTARSVSPTSQAVVEQFVAGREFSIDGLIVDGQLLPTGLARRHIYFAPYFVELGHTIPASVPAVEERVITRTLAAAARALGLTTGAAKGDIFLNPAGEVYVGEIAARLSGGFMSGWTYPLASGVQLTRAAVALSLGERPTADLIEPTGTRIVAERALISAPGVVAAIDHGDSAARCDHLFIHTTVGASVAPPTNNVQKVANAIAAGADGGAAEERALDALNALAIDLAPGNGETDRYMFHEGWSGRYAFYELSEFARAVLEVRASGAHGLTTARTKSDVVFVPHTIDGVDMFAATHPAIPTIGVARMLQLAEARGEARIVDRDHGNGRFIWRAIIAAGRQGLRYSRYLRV